ncbi:NAD(P)-dependent oxidoreductase [Planococcus salinus]|uniref:NAD(P)-dependent oxidoreductase n=1 Tax=Planococcus salinus TaxID=1848460 RepID=A0A3M8P758_9BACL|nr:NAD(P)-dependent oxidoreductase [Planococcus salinus]RNF39503.1 NAD(P)-dependent oxidoreductase [Planococcus salinus]
MKIGVIGCGAMGAGMVKNLLKNDREVWTFDPDEKKQQQMKQLGAVPVGKMSDVASDMDAFVLSLPLAHLVEQALTSEDGLLKRAKRGALILDMSTTDVELTKKLARQAKEQGIYFYDCPVSNGPKGADEGTLSIMVGGDEEKYKDVLPVLQNMGTAITYVGPSGSGQVVKLSSNIVVAGIISLLSEAFKAGEEAGVDPSVIAQVMQNGTAQNRVMDVFGDNLLKHSHENVVFLLNHMKKDVDLFYSLANDSMKEESITAYIQKLYQQAQSAGLGMVDATAVQQLYGSTEREPAN